MDITVGKQHPAPARRHRRVPWSPRAWGQVISLASGIPVQLVTTAVLLLLVRATEVWSVKPLVVLWIVVMAGLFLLAPVLTRAHRHRLRTTAGVGIPPQPRRSLLTWRGLTVAVRSQTTWRQLCYHVLAAPALAAAAAVAIGVWLAGAACGLSYAYAWGLRPSSMLYRATYGSTAGHHPFGIVLMLGGLAGLAAAPWIADWVQSLDIRASRTLL